MASASRGKRTGLGERCLQDLAAVRALCEPPKRSLYFAAVFWLLPLWCCVERTAYGIGSGSGIADDA